MDGVLFARLRMALAGLACVLAPLAWAGDSEALRMQGEALRRQGDVDAAIGLLRQSRDEAQAPDAAARAAASLGAALLQARRLDEAQEALEAARRTADASVRAATTLELGNLALLRKQTQRARDFYSQVAADTAARPADALAAQLNLVRLAPAAGRQAALATLLPPIAALPDATARAQLLLNAGLLAASSGASALPVAHAALEQVRRETQGDAASRLQVAALDGLAQLYESQGRWDEVIRLDQAALDAARPAPARPLQDLLMVLEWRQARAWRRQGRADLALAAATRAVDHAQAVRPDLPIDTADGRSTYQALLQPLLELYVDLQLAALDALPAERHADALTRVREAVEAMRQSEMQDFLGDRCTVEEADAAQLEPGAVALYPMLLPHRVELLVQTHEGLRRITHETDRAQVIAAARELAQALRNGDESYIGSARRLYDWLIRPAESELAGMQTLVVVPDGPLRLVPFSVLNDGRQPLVQRIAIGTVTGMSMTDAARGRGGRPSVLLAGVALPGPVVERIAAADVLRSAPSASAGRAIGASSRASRSASRALGQREAEAMRQELALPGVRDEVSAIATLTGGKVLLDGAFTVAAFEREAEGGDYRVVHIASHGVFGGTAESSYILAYDDLLGINRLQGVLRSEKLQQSPIDLLALSACETAEGNDRAPLGIAGAAMRARARSVLGTLWPVDDEAARQVMESFYRGLARGGQGKAAALRAAQLELLRQPATRHPYFWAPFSLVGNWR